jgi:tol-pal system protein YbgF
MTDPIRGANKLGRLAALIAAAGLALSPAAGAQSVRRDVDGPAQTQAQADAQQDRIEELQSQLAAATAENENLQHQLSDAQHEVQRLQAMVGNLASVNQDLAAGTAPPNASPGPAAAPEPNGAPPGEGRGDLTAGAPEGQLGTLPANAAPVTAPTPVDPGDLYSQALDQLKNGQYAEAEAEFADLLQNYPRANFANDARFWYAFTLLARHNDHDAAQNFIQYLHDAPNAARAPEAQVRLGMAFAEMGQTQQACTFYTNLPQRYPHAPRDIRSLAVNEAARHHCR